MKNIWSHEIDSILSVGYSLEGIGVRNWALQKEAALAALEQLFVEQIGILGGDVYVGDRNNIRASYDNWYCNRGREETDAEFVKRSFIKAKSYVSTYNAGGREVFFAIVPDVPSACPQ